MVAELRASLQITCAILPFAQISDGLAVLAAFRLRCVAIPITSAELALFVDAATSIVDVTLSVSSVIIANLIR